jgi:hypothetical protein
MNGSIEGSPGPPMRCFWIVGSIKKKVIKKKICVFWGVWPTVILSAYPKHPTPDPGPLSIAGVSPQLLRDLQTLDVIQWLSRNLDSKTAKAVHEAVGRGVKRIEQQLPQDVSLA